MSMWSLLRENARTLRALVAVCAATALAVLCFYQECLSRSRRERAGAPSLADPRRFGGQVRQFSKFSVCLRLSRPMPMGEAPSKTLKRGLMFCGTALSLIENMGLTTTRELGPALSTVRVFCWKKKSRALYDAPDISSCRCGGARRRSRAHRQSRCVVPG